MSREYYVPEDSEPGQGEFVCLSVALGDPYIADQTDLCWPSGHAIMGLPYTGNLDAP